MFIIFSHIHTQNIIQYVLDNFIGKFLQFFSNPKSSLIAKQKTTLKSIYIINQPFHKNYAHTYILARRLKKKKNI